MSRWVWATVLLVAAGGFSSAAAQPLSPLAPPDFPPAPVTPLPPAPVSRPAPVESILGAPVAVRGEPVRPVADPIPTAPPDGSALPVGYSEPPAVQKPGRAAALGAPTSAAPIPASAIEPASRTVPRPSPADPVNDFLSRRSSASKDGDRGGSTTTTDRPSWKFGEKMGEVLGQRSEWFRSDHAFDGFISPVTNPFLFEDPRALTEVRPIFIYQKIPGGQPDFHGGNVSYFGLQGRLAITDRLSFTINKLGGVWFNPGSGSSFQSSSGFSEFWFGPKYTFIRNEQTGSLWAGGLQFQLPTSNGAFQGTGSFSLVPWVSYAQNFFKDFRAGSFNAMFNTGYSFATGSSRSDYYYLSAHLDMDVANLHRFYPLIEMNWFLYTSNAKSLPIGSEGRDLINFGGAARGNGLLTGALGGRFKITESAQIGAAFEFPLAGPKDIFQYRATIDFILRY